MKGLLNFANSVAGMLSLLGFLVVTLRAVQFAFMHSSLGTTIVPPTPGQSQSSYKNDRMTLLVAVGALLFFEFVLDARMMWGRYNGDWATTEWLALASWLGKSVASLVLARQFSVIRCGERGWMSFLAFSVIVSFFLL